MKHPLLCALSVLSLASCGGGGSSGGATTAPNPPPVATIPPSSQYLQHCAPDNPYRADAQAPITSGTLADEKQWIRSYFDEAYLWYDQVPVVDSTLATYSGSMSMLDNRKVPMPLSNYFEALKTKQTTPTGALTDRFSFTYPTKAWNQLSQSGVIAGYGIEWVVYNSIAPNRLWRVSIVQPNSPAAVAGIVRGDTLKTVDGVDFANGSDTNTLNNALFPAVGSAHTLVFARTGSPDVPTSLAGRSDITIDPVPVTRVVTDPSGRKVGYLHFTDHIVTSEAKLIDAITTLKAANVTDLVLDLRYNGGGLLYIASELAYMIAGPNRVAGKFFEKTQFNAKRVADNAQAPDPFYNTSCLLDPTTSTCTKTQPLPSLNLGRVFVIGTGDTCSASESVINGLRGVDVDVQLIGSQTCGKPYVFIPPDNCGVTYFPIEGKNTNYKGFGDYADGFAPATAATSNTQLAGCASTDDLDHPLGNTSERMLGAALQRAAYGNCPGATAVMKHTATPSGRLDRSPVREMQLLLPSGRAR